jgi:hypothetical protein
MTLSRRLAIAVAAIVLVGVTAFLLTTSLDTTVPRESDLEKQPELAPFLVGRQGFRGIEFNLDTNYYSFAYPTSVLKSGALFAQVRSAAESQGWKLVTATDQQQSYAKKSGAYPAANELDKVTISYDVTKHEVTVVRERARNPSQTPPKQ